MDELINIIDNAVDEVDVSESDVMPRHSPRHHQRRGHSAARGLNQVHLVRDHRGGE